MSEHDEQEARELIAAGHSQQEAAKQLGISRSALRRRLGTPGVRSRRGASGHGRGAVAATSDDDAGELSDLGELDDADETEAEPLSDDERRALLVGALVILAASVALVVWLRRRQAKARQAIAHEQDNGTDDDESGQGAG
jgi:hypothetical protein